MWWRPRKVVTDPNVCPPTNFGIFKEDNFVKGFSTGRINFRPIFTLGGGSVETETRTYFMNISKEPSVYRKRRL